MDAASINQSIVRSSNREERGARRDDHGEIPHDPDTFRIIFNNDNLKDIKVDILVSEWATIFDAVTAVLPSFFPPSFPIEDNDTPRPLPDLSTTYTIHELHNK